MVEFLLDNHIPRVWVICIVGFITFLLGEVYLISTLVPLIPVTTSSAIIVIAIKISWEPSPRVLLESFEHTVLLEVADFIASPAPNIDASSWSSGRVLFFLLLS